MEASVSTASPEMEAWLAPEKNMRVSRMNMRAMCITPSHSVLRGFPVECKGFSGFM